MFFKSIAEDTETSDAAAKETNQSEKEPEIVTREDKNRKITAAEALKKLDEVKIFIEVNGSNNLNMIFNELIENKVQMKIKNKKSKVILEISLNLKIYFYSLLAFYEKILHLNFCDPFFAKNSKTLYSGHLIIVDTFFRNRKCLL